MKANRGLGCPPAYHHDFHPCCFVLTRRRDAVQFVAVRVAFLMTRGGQRIEGDVFTGLHTVKALLNRRQVGIVGADPVLELAHFLLLLIIWQVAAWTAGASA